MLPQNWLEFLTEQFSNIDVFQWAILTLGVIEVLLAKANNILLYPAGIAATVLASYSLFTAQLYAECLLHFYYLVMSIYGWWYWAKKRNNTAAIVAFTDRREWLISFVIIFGGWAVLYIALVSLTPSTVPVWDAWVSATAWAGTWLLARRRVENWLLLNLSNAFAIPLQFYKQLPLFAVLTFILFVVACFGYSDWKKIAKANAV